LRASAPTKAHLILTTALAYGNGSLHLGHALEAVLADAFARHRKAWGQSVIFLGADDNHGTATELRAAQEGLSPNVLVHNVGIANRADYQALGIAFTVYHRTHSPENAALCTDVFHRLRDKGLILRQPVTQLFDPEAGRFLDDRRVRGTCPSCGATNQPAGGCICGAIHTANELHNPVSVISGTTPVLRTADHLFLNIDPIADSIRTWIEQGGLAPAAATILRPWTHGDGTVSFRIRPWCITRVAPYFGFPVPGEDRLRFYVWFDAPLGYLAALDHHAGTQVTLPTPIGSRWRALWNDPSTEIVQVIGKDIIAFHGLFWPALLHAADARLPDRIHAHGFLSRNGTKLSKSIGSVPTLSEALARLPSDTLRLSLAAQAGPGLLDGDLHDDSFTTLHNGLLVGKIANIALRLRPFSARINDRLADTLPDPDAYQRVLDLASEAIDAYDAFDTAKVVRLVALIADEANAIIARDKPWQEDQAYALQATLTQALCLLRVIALLLAPLTPTFATRLLAIFPPSPLTWESLTQPPLGAIITLPPHLLDRLPPS
jgi:methionyl-tRNA synthetase